MWVGPRGREKRTQAQAPMVLPITFQAGGPGKGCPAIALPHGRRLSGRSRKALFAPQVCAFAWLHPGDRKRASTGFAMSSFSWREEVFYMDGRPPLAMLWAAAGGGGSQGYPSACPAASCGGQAVGRSGLGQGLGGCKAACPSQPGIPAESVWLCPRSPSPVGYRDGTGEGGRQGGAAAGRGSRG